MVKIDIAGNVATIKGYKWSGDNNVLVSLLNAMLDPAGPSGADPNPDLTAAQAAIDALGGEITRADETEYVEGRIY